MKNKFTVIGIILTTVILAGVAIFTATRLYQTRTTSVAPNVPSSNPAASGQICGGPDNIQCQPNEICQYPDSGTRPVNSNQTGICVVLTKNTFSQCSLSFTVNLNTATPTATPVKTSSPTPTPTKTATPTATATATAVPLCNSECSSSLECPSGLTCYIPSGSTAGNCRNTQCTTASNCFCSTATPTATPTSTATATPTSTGIVTATPTSNPQCNYSCTSNSNCPSSMICYIPSGSTAGNCRNAQCLSETDCACNETIATPTATTTSQPTLPVVGTSWPTILGTGFGILVILGSLLLAL